MALQWITTGMLGAAISQTNEKMKSKRFKVVKRYGGGFEVEGPGFTLMVESEYYARAYEDRMNYAYDLAVAETISKLPRIVRWLFFRSA